MQTHVTFGFNYGKVARFTIVNKRKFLQKKNGAPKGLAWECKQDCHLVFNGSERSSNRIQYEKFIHCG